MPGWRDGVKSSVAAGVLAGVLLLAASCGENPSSDSSSKAPAGGKGASGGTTVAVGKTGRGSALTPAEATVGPHEETAMPASGIKEAASHPPPRDPPKGVKTYPATSNRNVSGEVDYPREPPTNGDHAPIWQNCGFYPRSIRDENAVHSLDHGAVWISYRPNLPAAQIATLRRLAKERYVLVSPYPGQPAPVIATAWRNQLYLKSANDPRLRRFVDQFRLSDTAPRSGNGCVLGVGRPRP